MNTSERRIVRALRERSAVLTEQALPPAAVTHACREIHEILTLLTDSEQPYMKEATCYRQADERLHALDAYLTRHTRPTTLQKEAPSCP